MAKKTVDENDFVMCPFEISRCQNEGAPYPFQEIRQRKSEGGRRLIVRVIEKPMYLIGRKEWGCGLGDYSINGWEERVSIERKSVADLFATLGSRRDEFEKEIDRLNKQCEWSAVMVEGTLAHVAAWKGHGPEPQSVIGTIVAWQQRYRGVHWMMPPTRDMAERLVFRSLERFWLDRQEQ